MREHTYCVEATVRMEYQVDATSPEAAMEIVRTYTDGDLSDPSQALGMVSVERAECYDDQPAFAPE